MLSAKEARAISGPTVQEQVDELLSELETKIKAAAKMKKRETLVKSEPFARWALSESNRGEVGNKLYEELKTLGYVTETYYHEGQFADYGLIIRW